MALLHVLLKVVLGGVDEEKLVGVSPAAAVAAVGDVVAEDAGPGRLDEVGVAPEDAQQPHDGPEHRQAGQ